MSRDELRTRSGQEIAKRWDAVKYGMGFRGVRKIPPSAAPAEAHFFFEPRNVKEIAALIRTLMPGQADSIVEEARRIACHHFNLLGYTDLDYGKTVDWHLDAAHGRRAPRKRWYKIPFLDFGRVGDHKITWELNRHQHLVTLARAYWLTGEETFVAELLHQWKRWQKANPYPIGINWASSLEVAFRSLSWIWVDQLLQNCTCVHANFHAEVARALRAGGRHIAQYLSTYFSPNTHLLGEAVALFFIGTLYPQIPESGAWQKKGWAIVLEESERQVRADGLHFEQSVYYHVYALDFFLHARVLASRNQVPIPRSFDERLERMLEILAAMSQSGPPPRLGDDDGGRLFDPRRNRAEHMVDPLSTGAAVFGRADFKAAANGLKEETLWLLGAEGAAKFNALEPTEGAPASKSFATSGIYVMAGGNGSAQRLVIAAGPTSGPAAGHAHADALSVHFAVNGREWLIDPGTFCYMGEGKERRYFRSTGAHNTLQVDGEDQAENDAPFSWGSPWNAQTVLWVAGKSFALFAGRHDGYRRLPQPVVHERWLVQIKPEIWLIRDLARGEGIHQLDLHWHLAPGFQPRGTGKSNAVLWSRGDESLTLLPAEGHGWSQQITQGWCSPVYGSKQPAHVLDFQTRATLPGEFALALAPVEKGQHQIGTLERMKSDVKDPAVSAYRLNREGESHCFFFAEPGQAWELGAWRSDARFLYYGTAAGRQPRWVLCDGSYAEINRLRAIECRQIVKRFEWYYQDGQAEISCSDPSAVSHTSDETRDGQGIELLGQGPGGGVRRLK